MNVRSQQSPPLCAKRFLEGGCTPKRRCAVANLRCGRAAGQKDGWGVCLLFRFKISILTVPSSKGPPWRAPPWGVFDGPAVVRTRTGRPTAVGKKQSGGLFFRPRVESHQARAWSQTRSGPFALSKNFRTRPKQAETDRPCHQARAWSHIAHRAFCFAPNLRPRPKQI